LNTIKLIFLNLLLVSTLFADFNSDFNNAKEDLEKKSYQEAYDKFYTLFLNNLRNPNVNFYLGQSAFMMKDYDSAISAYERVLYADENAVRAKLELARCYIGNGSFEKAREMFLEILEDEKDLPPNVVENINKYLTAIDEKDSRHSLSGVLIIGTGWDDNVESISTGFISEVFDDKNGTTPQVSAWTHQEMLALNHVYKISSNVNWKNDGLFFIKTFLGYSQRNIQFIQYSPSLSVKHTDKLIVDYGLLFSKVWLDMKALVTNYAFNPRIKYFYSKDLLLNAAFRYQQKFNNSENRDRDSNFYEAMFSAQAIHTPEISSMYEARFSRESAIRGSLTDVDYDQLGLTAALAYKTTDDLSLSLKGKYFYKPYEDDYVLGKTNRIDDEYQAYLSATYILSKKYVLQAEYVYTDHKSNYNDFEFIKNTFTLNFISLF